MTTRRGFLAGLLATAAAPALAPAALPVRTAGVAYYAFGSFDLAEFGRQIPNLEFILCAEMEESAGADGWVRRRPTGRIIGPKLAEGPHQAKRIWADQKLIYERPAT
jgi:hypothetical protein